MSSIAQRWRILHERRSRYLLPEASRSVASASLELWHGITPDPSKFDLSFRSPGS